MKTKVKLLTGMIGLNFVVVVVSLLLLYIAGRNRHWDSVKVGHSEVAEAIQHVKDEEQFRRMVIKDDAYIRALEAVATKADGAVSAVTRLTLAIAVGNTIVFGIFLGRSRISE